MPRIPPSHVARGAALALMLLAAGAAEAACRFADQGEGRVAAVLDARTFRMSDGREVRLAGIESGDGNGTAALAALVAGRDVTLHGADDRPDRYGRQPAFVFVAGHDGPVQAALVANGDAVVSPVAGDDACRRDLLAAEDAARRARRGLWADPAAIKNAESGGDILARTGRFTVVEGKVVSARQAGATFYINFGRRWTEGLAVTIPRRMMPVFEAAGLDLKAVVNRRLRVRGVIERRGGPRIAATRTAQIELIDAATDEATQDRGSGD